MTDQMRFQDYITWFKSNSDLTSLIGYSGGFFAMDYVDNVWRVGYKYYEDYDGDYFLKNLFGENESLIDALQESYDKTCVVVRQLRERLQGLRKPTEFKIGNQYTTVAWGTDGGVIVRYLICTDNDSGIMHQVFLKDRVTNRTHVAGLRPSSTMFEEIE